MKKILLLIFALLALQGIYAQKKKHDYGLIFLLGPSATYQLESTTNIGEYNENKLSWQVDAQFGFISTRHQTNRGNMLLAFGNAGSATNVMLNDILKSSIHADKQIAERSFNLYHTLEGGMIIMKLLRLSGGVGRQYFTLAANDETSSLMYYVGTAGLNFDFNAVNLGLNTILLTGGELEKSLLRFSAGFLVKF